MPTLKISLLTVDVTIKLPLDKVAVVLFRQLAVMYPWPKVVSCMF